MSTTADPAARTPGRHAGPEREITVLEAAHLRLQAKALIDRMEALMSASSGAGPIPRDQLLTELCDWSGTALDILREVTR
jgi:hypothetical protein